MAQTDQTGITAPDQSEHFNSWLAAVVESSSDAIIGKTLDGVIVNWNKAAEILYGYPTHEAIGKPISLLLPPGTTDEIPQILEQIRTGGERVKHFETVRRRKDGTNVDVSLTVSPVQDSQGTVIGASTIARDITVQKRTAETLRRQSLIIQQSQKKLRWLAADLIRVQEDERRKLSRELHDDVVQRLGMLAFQIQTWQRKHRTSAPTPDEIGALHTQVLELSDEVRRLAYQLHPAVLDDLGLAVALEAWVRQFAERAELTVQFQTRRLPEMISRPIASCLYRVAQEALQNVAKHARTTHVTVLLARSGRHIGLCVADTGVGFQIDIVQDENFGLGLTSMEERLQLVNGTFTIRSRLGLGTHMHAMVPIGEGQS